MARERFLAGIAGYRPNLCYSPADDHCIARFPGYDKPVALLPSNTVDAVFTSKGMLVYKDSSGEVRALQVPDHEPIYAAAVAASQQGETSVKSVVTDNGDNDNMITRTNILNEKIRDARIEKLDGTKITAGKLYVGSAASISLSSKDVHETFVSALVQEYIAPLVKNVQILTIQNSQLTAKIRQMEKLLADRTTAQPVAAVPSQDSPIREVSWGDQGGLPNFLYPQDNPFGGKRRG
jgi:hypothetical protein